jgi:hypothetical protein
MDRCAHCRLEWVETEHATPLRFFILEQRNAE